MSRSIFQPAGRARRQSGTSLIEVLVSMVIGLVVVGAVLLNYVGVGASGRQQSGVSQLTEDAQIALTFLARDLQLAGYTEVTGVNTTAAGGTATYARVGGAFNPVYGCTTGFNEVTATWATTPNCGTGTTHVFEASYQTTTANSHVSGGLGSDCLGAATSGVNESMSGAITNTFTTNRYFVRDDASGRPELYCASPKSGAQPIAENVQSMMVWYGVAPLWDATAPATRQPQRYVTADLVATWTQVVSVRVCLLMRTAEPVLTGEDVEAGANQYRDCAGTLATSNDRRIYRAFFTTVALRNRSAF